jgi:hypothetical protein
MRRRQRGEPPLPPPLRGIVLDGSNIIASGSGRATERLDLAVAWCKEWRPDLPVMVFLDAATARRCRPEVQDALRARCADVTPGRARYAICPRGESADSYALAHAQQHQALVVSNDRFMDQAAERAGLLTVQFQLQGMVFTVFEEATWFRRSGSALRVPMEVLRNLVAEPHAPQEGTTGGDPEAPDTEPRD